MILVFLVICISIVIFFWTRKYSDDFYACCGKGFSLIPLVICTIILLVLIHSIVSLNVINEKITMYEKENAEIEIQIAETIQSYQEYEKEIFTEVAPDSSITLIALYPELKSDALVSKQIEVYISNTNQIKTLKTEQINGYICRWWLYFGGGN